MARYPVNDTAERRATRPARTVADVVLGDGAPDEDLLPSEEADEADVSRELEAADGALWDHLVRLLGQRRLDPDARYGLRLSLFAVAFVLLVVPFGLLLEQVLTDGVVTRWDASAAEVLVRMSRESRFLEVVFEGLSFVGKPVFLFVCVGATAVYLLRTGQRRILVYLLSTTIVGGVVDTAIKALVGRGRPSFDGQPAQAFGNSFPSGHALASSVCAGAIVMVLLPHVRRSRRVPIIVFAVVLVLLIGVSRLGLGMHFVSDVTAGYVIGVAWLAFATAAFNLWRIERHDPAVHLATMGIPPVVDHPNRHSGDLPAAADVDQGSTVVTGGSVLWAGHAPTVTEVLELLHQRSGTSTDDPHEDVAASEVPPPPGEARRPGSPA